MNRTSNTSRPKCKMCGKSFYGRSDKIFCTVKCKSAFHYREKKAHLSMSYKLNFQLLKNKEIIEELMGEKKIKHTVLKSHLQSLGFDLDSYNRRNVSAQNKTYYYVFNYSWFIEGDQVKLHKLEEKKLSLKPKSNPSDRLVRSS